MNCKFTYSSTFFYLKTSLVPNGGEKVVTLDNVDEYVSATLDFVLEQGIRRQMNAFRQGFNAVFPIDRLGSFAPEEVSYPDYQHHNLFYFFFS